MSTTFASSTPRLVCPPRETPGSRSREKGFGCDSLAERPLAGTTDGGPVLTHPFKLLPRKRRRQLKMAPGLVGEELSELAIVHVFYQSASEFSEPLFTASSTGNPRQGTSRRGRLLFDYFLSATQEKVISSGAAPRKLPKCYLCG